MKFNLQGYERLQMGYNSVNRRDILHSSLVPRFINVIITANDDYSTLAISFLKFYLLLQTNPCPPTPLLLIPPPPLTLLPSTP